jgi:hypothetical protein
MGDLCAEAEGSEGSEAYGFWPTSGFGLNSKREQCARHVREAESESRRQEAITRRGGGHTCGQQAWHPTSAAMSKEEIVSLRAIPSGQSRSSPAWHNLGSASQVGNPTVYLNQDGRCRLFPATNGSSHTAGHGRNAGGSKASTPWRPRGGDTHARQHALSLRTCCGQ